MVYQHPSLFYPELTDDRLARVAESLLDIRYSTIQDMSSPFDDAYTRETAVFGRSRNMLIQLCMSGKYEWLSLASPGMDVTFCIGNVPCRFFRDDPEFPEKPGFFKRNTVDGLFSLDENDPVMWRFVVEKALTEEDEDHVFLIGYNAYQEKVSQWAYGSSGSILHSVDSVVPEEKELPPAEVDVREDVIRKDSDAQNE